MAWVSGTPAPSSRCRTSEAEQTADHLLDPIRLRGDRRHRGGQLVVACDLRLQLLGPRRDHAQRRRDLVGDADRQRAEGGGLVRAIQPLVAAALQIGDRQRALQQQLLPLHAQRDAAEQQHQSGGRRHAEQQPPPRPGHAIAQVLGAADRHDVGGARVGGVGDAGDGRAGRQAERRRFLARDPDRPLAAPDRFDDARRGDLGAGRRAQRRVARPMHEQARRARPLGAFEDRAQLGVVAAAVGAKRVQRDAERPRDRCLPVRQLAKRGLRFAHGVPVGEAGHHQHSQAHRASDQQRAEGTSAHRRAACAVRRSTANREVFPIRSGRFP
jgi:hypothetical protein